MGENQGMIWIIIGVILVGGAIFFLSDALGGSIKDSGNNVQEQMSEANTKA